MLRWTGKTREERAERLKKIIQAEEDAERKYREHLKVIKDILDLYGEDALSLEDRAFLGKHWDYFYPEEG